MRLFLLPVSTRRTLIYCERVQQQFAPGEKPPLSERIIAKATETWAGWERAEKGWQKQLTVQGNRLFKRIPYEEWGLKTIPSASKQRLEDADSGKLKFECLYPRAFMKEERVPGILKALATERQGLHRKRMWNSIIGMPITIPFAAIPVIPNIPFFYLCFRAYSHYRALYGGKLLEHLMSKNLVAITPSAELDEMYTAGLLHPHRSASREAPYPGPAETEQVSRVVEVQTNNGKEDVMLLQRWNGKLIAERFHLPEMEVEIERAVEQVESAIEKEKSELHDEKKEIMEAMAQKTDVKNPDIRR
ncbi:hypothetical protein LTR37_016317 [Vermiconidia calcicola]|uniref:Uncharacterized protein n=1 Tax=Vermiconidia calcicola TaxID=1690605 RepID=A0ACC3MPR1_9PEZI|nr:hypothetical protein LTR37_016317 [Vermiconidia calcicola]